ncbi:MAG TPA: Uma2 family endonuclease [Polyangiaceae bacterium]
MQSDSPLWNPDAPVPPPGEQELPYEDGEPMESNEHRLQMVLLIQSLKLAWANRDDFFVGGNMFVYFSEAQVKGTHFRGPDVFVVLGTSRRSRLSWVAWGEGGRLPDVVIELLSNKTRNVDRGEKMRVYSKVWRTPEYFLYDPFSHEFDGFRLDPVSGDYQPMAKAARGDLESRVLGLGLGVRESTFEDLTFPWLRWLAPGGEMLPTPEEQARAEASRADGEMVRADTEKQRADTEKQRADQLAAELRRR